MKENINLTINDIVHEYISKFKIYDIQEVGFDPHETVYSENYASALLAAMAAYDIRRRGIDKKNIDLYKKSVKRAIEILENTQGNKFQRLFIRHYTLLSVILLPEEYNDLIDTRHLDILLRYKDDCSVINANCVAMKWAVDVFRCILDRNSCLDEDCLDLVTIYCKNNKAGFINDAVKPNFEEDAMPIAYHGFTVFLLSTAYYLAKKYNTMPVEVEKDVFPIIEKGVNWWQNIISMDGSAAYSGRSGYQLFNYGVNTYFQALTGKKEDILATLSYIQQFKKGNGEYSCTPNYFDNSLRIGFESYTHVNMYNGLAFVALCLAEQLLYEKIGFLKLADKSDRHFIDPESGYAFYREKTDGKERFFACSLRKHINSAANAASAFHFHYTNIPIPIGTGLHNAAISEGVIFEDSQRRKTNLDTLKNVEVKTIKDGFLFQCIEDDFKFSKKITLYQNYIRWDYECEIKNSTNRLLHSLPIIVNDGKNETKFYKKSYQTINLQVGTRLYQVFNNNASEMELSLNRDFTSPFGIVSNIEMTIKPSDAERKRYCWSSFMFLYDENSDVDLCSLQGIEPKIQKMEMRKKGDTITFEIESPNESISYVLKLYCNGELERESKIDTGGFFKYFCENNEGYYTAQVDIIGEHGYSRCIDVPIQAVEDSCIPCSKQNCTACMACANICPCDAIRKEYDINGFAYPQIDKEICISCGLCEEVCPSMKKIDIKKQPHDYCLAAWTRDDAKREAESSGGVFSAIAEYILSKNGVVYGTYYDEKLNVKIGSIDSRNIEDFFISKHVESNVGYAFRDVEKDLRNGKMVLYSGSPCQVAGLYAYLKQPYDNLYTIDFICGGFIGNGIWETYKNALEKVENKQLIGYTFRDKKFGWNNPLIKMTFSDNYYYVKPNEDKYYRLFQNGDTVRDNCFSCRYLKEDHCSDIIIGDYNGWRNISDFPFDYEKGVSQVILNTEKGKSLLEKCRTKIETYKRPIEDAIEGNKRYSNLREYPVLKEAAYQALRTEKIDYFKKDIRLNSILDFQAVQTYDEKNRILYVKADVKLSNDAGVDFAWYIYKDGDIFEKIWYKPANELFYTIKQLGVYSVKIFVRDKKGAKTTYFTPKLDISKL